MNNEIARPEVFLKEVHPSIAEGSIILERTIKRTKLHSQVKPHEAEKIARLSYEVPDLFFSVSSYYGKPLLTNFANTRCLVAVFNGSHDVTVSKIYVELQSEGFPLPTAVVTDGQQLLFFWILKNIISSHEFHKVYLLQHGLYQLLKKFKPSKKMLEIDLVVPLIGTINSKKGVHVGVIAFKGELLDNDFAEDFLLRNFSNSDYDKLEIHSRAILELHALLAYRFFTWNIKNSCDDWLLFFGASLCYFCTEQQLKIELRAIAESLENNKWKIIKDKYDGLINNITKDAAQGFIVHNGIRISINESDWFVLVGGKLDVEQDEIERLSMSVVTGNYAINVSKVIPKLPKIHPVGEIQFIPVERLTIKEVA